MRAVKNTKDWRFIPYAKLSAFENMAVDEYMLCNYKKTGRPVFRLYGWQPAAISIGKYQDPVNDINLEECAENDCAIVRRMTGGGAIYHDNELTYSLVCSEEDIGCAGLDVKQSFEKLNGFIFEAYKNLGLSPKWAKDLKATKRGERQAAHCFSANEEYDITVKGKKMGGNAQARKKNVIFQHGSIPFEACVDKAEKYFRAKIDADNFTGLNRLMSGTVPLKQLEKALIKGVKTALNAALSEEPLKEAEFDKVEKIIAERYGNDEWNLRGESSRSELSVV